MNQYRKGRYASRKPAGSKGERNSLLKSFSKRVFHGGGNIITDPEAGRNTEPCDFGKGFYTTENREYAIKMARDKKNKDDKKNTNDKKTKVIVVNEYDFDDEKAYSDGAKIYVFNDPIEWTKFVVWCRENNNPPYDWDILIGESADNIIDDVIENYRLMEAQGNIDWMELYRLFQTHQASEQILFHTDEAIKKYLKYVRHEIIHEGPGSAGRNE